MVLNLTKFILVLECIFVSSFVYSKPKLKVLYTQYATHLETKIIKGEKVPIGPAVSFYEEIINELGYDVQWLASNAKRSRKEIKKGNADVVAFIVKGKDENGIDKSEYIQFPISEFFKIRYCFMTKKGSGYTLDKILNSNEPFLFSDGMTPNDAIKPFMSRAKLVSGYDNFERMAKMVHSGRAKIAYIPGCNLQTFKSSKSFELHFVPSETKVYSGFAKHIDAKIVKKFSDILKHRIDLNQGYGEHYKQYLKSIKKLKNQNLSL